ncbi:hypothetical protein F4810DRAFT_188196 [Camillea tinctor]|nr:hypothetical protein F4810DRAFT_188196 [Camillea tinctor]
MDFKRTTARLRHPFAYSSDPSSPPPYDSDSDPDAPPLDEQEQEALIHALSAQNQARNAQFRLFLLSVPVLSSVPYLLALGHSPWVPLLALTSLSCTGWTLYSLPAGVTGVRALDSWVAGGGPDSDAPEKRRRRAEDTLSTAAMGVGPMASLSRWAGRRKGGVLAGTPPFWAPGRHRSPLQQYLPFLNAALCAVLVLIGLLSPAAENRQRYWGHVGLENLPAVVYVVVLAAKMVMGSVDPERELTGLKYGYKGA